MRNRLGAKIPWSRPLGDLVQSAIDPVLTRRGFGLTALVLYWDDIVGERLAAVSRPVKVQWPARLRDPAGQYHTVPAALIVRVETGSALELQHLTPVILERVNAHFGWRSISRIVLMQGPVTAPAAPRRIAAQPLNKAAETAAAQLVGKDLDHSLQLALVRLGARIFAGP
jgi:hypothetical protein